MLSLVTPKAPDPDLEIVPGWHEFLRGELHPQIPIAPPLPPALRSNARRPRMVSAETTARVLAVLGPQWVALKAIASQAGCAREPARLAVRRLVKEGHVEVEIHPGGLFHQGQAVYRRKGA